jgi:hypothetical protein
MDPYTFIVQIRFNENLLSITDFGALQNPSKIFDDPITGNSTFSGTLYVDQGQPESFSETLTITFQREDVWYSIIPDGIVLTLIDPCDPSSPEILTQNLDGFDFNDLRFAPSNNVSTLRPLGYLDGNCLDDIDKVVIGDELIVDQDYCFGLPNSNTRNPISLLPGAKIRVLSGATLTLLNNDLFSCGDELAQDIIVESGGSLIVRNSTISDCRMGVDAKAGTTISVLNTVFNDNYTGVNLDMQSAPFRTSISGFEGNVFRTLNGLKQPFPGMPEQVEGRGFAGIRLANYLDFNVFGNNVQGVTDGNTFTQLANGIVGFNTTMNIGNMNFSNMNSGGTAYDRYGYGIYLEGRNNSSWANINQPWLPPMLFDNCITGIKAVRYAGKVERCTLTNADKGIVWESSHTRDIRILDNQMPVRQNGIQSWMNEPLHPISTIEKNRVTVSNSGAGVQPPLGISADEGALGSLLGTGWRMNNNTVTTLNGGRGIQYRNGQFADISANTIMNQNPQLEYHGLWIDGAAFTEIAGNIAGQNLTPYAPLGVSTGIRSSAGWGNALVCNCVDNTNIGIQFYDLADFENQVRTNHLNNHGPAGLQIGDAGVGNAFIGIQTHTGNLWDLAGIPNGGFGGRNWSSQFLIQLSEFVVDGNENAGFNPPVSPSTGWFSNDPDEQTTPTCNISCNFPGGTIPPFAGEGGSPTGIDHWIADGVFPQSFGGPDMEWKARYRLYRRLLRQPGLEQADTKFAQFKNSEENSSAGRLAALAEARSALFDADSSGAVLHTELQQRMLALQALDSLRQSGTTVVDTIYQTALAARLSAQTAFDQYSVLRDSLRQVQIQQLRQQNATVSTPETPAANHKAVNAAWFDVLLGNALDSTTLAALGLIAAQCPLLGGDAVYEARALIAPLTGEIFDDASACDGQGAEERHAEPETAYPDTGFRIFPNPTAGIVQWTGNAPVSVRIFDQLGRLIIDRNIPNNVLDISHLKEGFYRIQIIGAGNEQLYIGGIFLVK